MCALRHQLCDDSVIHQMRLSRPKQKYALAPGALSRETNYAAYASAAASGHYRLPTLSETQSESQSEAEQLSNTRLSKDQTQTRDPGIGCRYLRTSIPSGIGLHTPSCMP